MKFPRVLIAVALLTVGFPIFSFGLVIGGSNFGIFGYPSHECNPPYSKPYKPFSFNYQWEIDQYNSEVEIYNRELQEFLDCIDEYVNNAKNDIERIREKANEAINEANSQ